MPLVKAGVAAVAAVLLSVGCSPPGAELTARINTMSADAIQSAVSGLSFGECRTRPRTAEGAGPGGAVTRLQICAVNGGENAGGPGTPSTGVWVARIVNVGNVRDQRWKLRTGPYETWIVAYGPAPVKYAMVEISTTIPADPPRTIVMDGEYHHCNHPATKARARASFGLCSDNPGHAGDPPDPAPSPVRRGMTQLRSLFLPATLNAREPSPLDGPAWIDCGGDCCTTDRM